MSDILEHRLTSLEKVQDMQNKKIEQIEKDVKDIVKLLSARPTWFIAILFAVLTNVTVGLIVYVVTHH